MKSTTDSRMLLNAELLQQRAGDTRQAPLNHSNQNIHALLSEKLDIVSVKRYATPRKPVVYYPTEIVVITCVERTIAKLHS